MRYLLIILIFTGCSTAKELLEKAEKKDPAIVATYARDKYPCKDLLKNDTAIIWRDSTVYIECPDTSQGNDYEVIVRDTINKVVTKTIRVPVNIRTAGQVITRWYEDSAKLKIYATELNGCNTTNKKFQAANDSLVKKVAHKTKENWIWRIIASVLICWQVWKIYRRIMIKV